MNINGVTLLVYQIVQMLSSIEEVFNVLILVVVRYRVTEALIDASLVVLLNHSWPEDTPVGHIFARLHIEDCSDSSLLQS